ncbi:hypothetical protein [Phenylobacterium sp.]|uniref:hypothetical protein n=1 Tax=Phenylobacterium sp. TaxID=1871053 RepID=UPI0025DC4B82|nr:hypothetical protein [Phenylobacterium sp.]
MASFDLPELPNTRMSPELMMGVASPLWSYFGAAAASGVAYWWMTRWARPMNLEAMFEAARTLPAPPAAIEAIEAVAETVEAAAEVADDALEAAMGVTDDLPVAPVGGEAGPFSPLLEAQIVEPEVPPAPVLEAGPEPILDEPAPLLGEPAPEPSPKARVKKAAPPPVEPEA